MVRKISESGGKNKKMGANPHEKNRSSTEILKKSAKNIFKEKNNKMTPNFKFLDQNKENN